MGTGQTQETTLQKATATAAGIVAGAALLAAVIGISSSSSWVLAKIALDSPPEAAVKSAPAIAPQTRSVKASPITPLLGKSRIVIKAKQGSWIDACADGRTVLRRYLAPSNTADLGFSSAAVVRTGNAGGVEISVNGAASRSVGAPGEVRVMRFDAKGLHFLEQGDPGTECGQ